VLFPDDSLCDTPGIAVHPLQLYDAVLPLIILGVLIAVDRRGGEAVRPFLLPLMIGLYALARFGTEFLRPQDAGQGLLLSQRLELGAVFTVVLLVTVGQPAWLRLVRNDSAQGRTTR
jgi:prolipoprotein diacylglyceryltransferase